MYIYIYILFCKFIHHSLNKSLCMFYQKLPNVDAYVFGSALVNKQQSSA